MQILTFFSHILLLLFIYLSFNRDTYFTFTIYFLKFCFMYYRLYCITVHGILYYVMLYWCYYSR